MRSLPYLLAVFLFVGSTAAAERGFVPVRRAAGDHVALVIGNGAYPDVPLANPVNDAADVAHAFESIGFQVQLTIDADKAQMLQAISQFGDRLPKAKAAVFYYAGHGVQVDGGNWLLPVARQVGEVINREDEVRLRAVDAGEVLLRMERARVPMAMVILDACRNNPFKGSGRSSVKGLAQLNAPPGSIVVYATAPGQVAADGNDRNSPFTRAFLSQLPVPGQPIDTMLMQVRRGVREATQGVQIPWSMTSMTDTFAFVPALAPDEERAMKEAMLKDLQGQAAAIALAESAAAEKKRQEESALAAKQAEVEKLDAQIAEMKGRIGGAGAGAGSQPASSDELQSLLVLARRQKAQQQELADMQRKADEARLAREAEIARMKEADAQAVRARDQQRLDQLASDLKDYREIVDSGLGPALVQQAWDAVLKKWGQPSGSIPRGDTAALEAVVAPSIFAQRKVVAPPPDADQAAHQAFADGSRQALERFAAAQPQHPRAGDARKLVAMMPTWAAGIGTDAGGTWARIVVDGQTQVMRLIPAGRFQMGAARGEKDERPVHDVQISQPFWLADSEVTQGLWLAVVGNSSESKGLLQAVTGAPQSRFTGDANRPVEQVSWEDCQGFFKRLNGRFPGMSAQFPTEAQWEYACRAGTSGDYAGDLPSMSWHDQDAAGQTHPVKTKQANAWGLYDMHGNVMEWCADWYGDTAYAGGPAIDPAGPLSGTRRVGRGGSWNDAAGQCRSASRYAARTGYRYSFLGFRIAAAAKP